MIPLAEHHYEQALAILMDKNNEREYRDNVMNILIKMAASEQNIFGATTEEFIKIRNEIYASIIEYKNEN